MDYPSGMVYPGWLDRAIRRIGRIFGFRQLPYESLGSRGLFGQKAECGESSGKRGVELAETAHTRVEFSNYGFR